MKPSKKSLKKVFLQFLTEFKQKSQRYAQKGVLWPKKAKKNILKQADKAPICFGFPCYFKFPELLKCTQTTQKLFEKLTNIMIMNYLNH